MTLKSVKGLLQAKLFRDLVHREAQVDVHGVVGAAVGRRATLRADRWRHCVLLVHGRVGQSHRVVSLVELLLLVQLMRLAWALVEAEVRELLLDEVNL